MKKKKLALHGGEKAVQGELPSWPIWDEKEEIELGNVLKSSVWGVQGNAIPTFSEEFGKLLGVSYVLPVFNGTVALVLALEALGVGPGDEVIVPDYTFMATAVAPVKVGAIPVLVDVDPQTYCIDPLEIEKAITENTRAIIPVHFGGHICDMDRINQIATRYNLFVIEDSAHAHGARMNGQCAGTFGHVGTFSFQSSKILTCGEGGAVVTNDKEIFERLYSYHNCGRHSDRPDYAHFFPGNNYRMSQFQAAILCAQLEKFQSQSSTRDKNGKLLTGLLEKIEGVTPQIRADGLEIHGHYLFTFVLDGKIDREMFKNALRAEGVLVQLEYPAIHNLHFMEEYVSEKGKFPVSTMIEQRSVWLYHNLLLGTNEQIHQTAEAVEKVLAAKDTLV